MKKFFSILGSLIFFTIVAMIVLMAVAPFFNYETFVVVSGSMEPEIKVGSIILIKHIDKDKVYDEIKVNDDISIRINPNTVLTHRVIKLDKEKDEIVTRGIANVVNDEPINSSMVIGKVIFTVPFIGYLLAIFKSPIILFIMVIVIILFYIYSKYKEMTRTSRK